MRVIHPSLDHFVGERHQVVRELDVQPDGGQPLFCRKSNDAIATYIEIWIGSHEKRADALLEERHKCGVQFLVMVGFDITSR